DRNAWLPPGGGVPSVANRTAYPPEPQAAEELTSEVFTARIDPMGEVFLPDIRARSRPGTAIAAMMPMIATTISSSISVNPSFFCSFFTDFLLERGAGRPDLSIRRSDTAPRD